ncbi:DsbA family protein [Nocardiopsis algeriensis]|uniref:DsbA family protein n=1 Tax=Nocardiopsis algeriensis TaxID=1478215 RepID=UPI003B4284CF
MPDTPEQRTRPSGHPAESGTRAGGGASWKVFLAAGAVLLLIAAAVAWGRYGEDDGEGQSGAAGADAPSTSAEDGTAAADAGEADEADDPVVRRQADDPTAMGGVEAPVVMVAYSDYHCPYCGRWVEETQPELMHYVESGDLRIEWRDFPVITDTSETVARASRAAAAQGAFWEFHEAYYAAVEGTGPSDPEELLVRIAEELGLDLERFDEDRNSDAAAELVGNDFSEGLAIGVTSTPTFLINGQAVMGAQPTEVFEEVIDRSLASSGGGGEGQ